jgi:hypothetical protein
MRADFGIKNMHFTKVKLGSLRAGRIFMEQVAEVSGVFSGVSDGKEHIL